MKTTKLLIQIIIILEILNLKDKLNIHAYTPRMETHIYRVFAFSIKVTA